jgi:glycosyltransferase involved in cell wall biosynthesis
VKLGYVHSVPFPSLDANVVQVAQMCRAFAQCGHEVTLFIPRAKGFDADEAARAAAREFYAGDLPFRVEFVKTVRIFGRLEMLGSVRSTLRAIQRAQPDLVYTRNPWTMLSLPRAGVPFVFEAHEERVHLRSRFLDRYLRRAIVRAAREPSCVLVVAISHGLRRIWENFGVPSEKLIFAHDGVEIGMFNLELSTEEARVKLGLVNARPLVVYTGALKADRGVDQMLEAARALPEMELCLVGGKDEEIAFWKSEAQRLRISNVRFAGRVPHREIPLWLAAADILLMMWTSRVPTIRGCSPMKMFEYMAAQRLIVGPAFPTIEEVLENGRDALLFEPDNPAALVSALREALAKRNDPALPRAARMKVEREYTWRTRAGKILGEIEKRGMRAEG